MFGSATYAGMLLPWALAVLVVQWAVGHRALWRRRRVLLVSVAVTTAYLVAADAVALWQGIWSIHRDRVLGVFIGNVPVEEALFFLATNAMVVQSVILLNAPEVRERLSRRLRRTAP